MTGGRARAGVSLAAPAPLAPNHDCSRFRCGRLELDDWLRASALRSEGRTARTYVVAAGARVVAYYSLAAGAVLRKALPSARARRNTPAEVPVVVVGRLAVDLGYRRRGIGAGMLKDAILRAVAASRSVGVRAILVHAIDDDAAGFYRHYGFTPSPVDSRTLMLAIETAIAALR